MEQEEFHSELLSKELEDKKQEVHELKNKYNILKLKCDDYEEDVVLYENQKEDLIKSNNQKKRLENKVNELEEKLNDYEALLLQNQKKIELVKSENHKLVLEKVSTDENVALYQNKAIEQENLNSFIQKEMSEKQLSLIENHQAEIKLLTEQICRDEQNYKESLEQFRIEKINFNEMIKCLKTENKQLCEELKFIEKPANSSIVECEKPSLQHEIKIVDLEEKEKILENKVSEQRNIIENLEKENLKLKNELKEIEKLNKEYLDLKTKFSQQKVLFDKQLKHNFSQKVEDLEEKKAILEKNSSDQNEKINNLKITNFNLITELDQIKKVQEEKLCLEEKNSKQKDELVFLRNKIKEFSQFQPKELNKLCSSTPLQKSFQINSNLHHLSIMQKKNVTCDDSLIYEDSLNQTVDKSIYHTPKSELDESINSQLVPKNGNFWSCEEPAPPILSDASIEKIELQSNDIPYIDQDVEKDAAEFVAPDCNINLITKQLKPNQKENKLKRIAELQRRNSMMPPALRTCYPAETQLNTPRKCDDAVKYGKVEDTMKRMTTKSDDEVPENVKIGSNDMLTIMQSAEKNNKRKSFFSEMHTTAKRSKEDVDVKIKPMDFFEIKNTPKVQRKKGKIQKKVKSGISKLSRNKTTRESNSFIASSLRSNTSNLSLSSNKSSKVEKVKMIKSIFQRNKD